MYLYLVQHGQAKSKDEDPERPLTQKGQDDVRKISALLKKAGISVENIWHSGKARAAQTADILATGVKVNQGINQHNGLAPNDEIGPVKAELNEVKQDLMIVGHLPFLSKLASELLVNDSSAEVVTFQQGDVVCLERNEDMKWSVRWIVIPDLLT